MNPSRAKVVVLKDGPYEVHGEVPLSLDWKEGALIPAPEGAHQCGCGLSVNRPLCDGTH